MNIIYLQIDFFIVRNVRVRRGEGYTESSTESSNHIVSWLRDSVVPEPSSTLALRKAFA